MPTLTKLLPKRAYFTVVTPTRAKALLATMIENRAVMEKRVDEIARALLAKEWDLTGETLVIDQHGRLTDGQHRLLACVKSNVPFETVVVEGIKPTDSGGTAAVRSLGQALTMRGEPHATVMAATLIRLVRFAAFLADPTGQGGQFGHNKTYIAPARCLAYLEAHPEVRDAVAFANNSRALRSVAAPSKVAWLVHLTHLANPRASAEFFEKLVTGENLAASHPCYVLRARLLAAKAGGAALSDAQFNAWLIKAWNAFVEKRKVTVRGLAWREEASRTREAETFPLPLLG